MIVRKSHIPFRQHAIEVIPRPGSDLLLAANQETKQLALSLATFGHPSAGGQRSRLGVVAAPGTWHSGCVNRYAPVPLAVMCRAEKAEIFRVRAAALSDRQQVVELQQMGGGTAPAGDRITIAAASLIALPHQAPDGGGNGAPGSSGPCATAGTRCGRRGPGSRTGPAAGR